MTREERELAREIGLTLQRLRHEQSLTQKQLAHQVTGSMDATYVGKIERGDQLPSLKILLRLSKALDVSVSTFFYPPVNVQADKTSPVLHLEPLLQVLRNRGIDGISLVRALLDAVGQHVLVTPPRRPHADESAQAIPADGRVIPLPEARSED